MEIIFGYIGAVLIGVSLGLIGGGGSILTVPVLVYLFGTSEEIGTAYSLFVVGTTSVIGAWQNYKKGFLDLKVGFVFAIPAFIAVFLTRKFLIPNIPEHLFQIGELTMTKGMGIMVFFAIIMLLSSVSMIRSGSKKLSPKEPGKEDGINIPLVLLEGAVVGTVTGVVGAGGGFLIVPALVILGRLDMKMAIGTSLMIIAMKSLIGFLGDVWEQDIEWNFLLIFTAISIGGVILGSYLGNYINGRRLKQGFGWFVLIMAVYIIGTEISNGL